MRLVLWGAKGHARVLADIASAVGAKVVAIGDRDNLPSPVPGIPLFHGREAFEAFINNVDGGQLYFAVAIGGNKGQDRLLTAKWLESLGIEPVTIQHPSAYVEPSATIAVGAQVLAHSYVGSNSSIHTQAILNTGSSLDHDCIAGEGAHLAPGSTVCGDVQIHKCAFVAAGATILPHIVIGSNAVVGAGSIVVRAVPDGALVVGVPAKQVER